MRLICRNFSVDQTDEQLDSYLNDFLKGSSTDLGWSLDKYDMSIVNPRSHIMDLITQWTEISTRYNLEEIVQQKKSMRAWREGLVEKLQPAAVREDVTQILERFDFEAEVLKKDDLKFYEYLISTVILHDRASRLYKEARSKSSFASRSKKTDAGAKPPTSGKRKHEKQSLPSIRTKTSEGNSRRFEGPTCWGCKKRGHTIHVCKDTSEDERHKILQSRGKARKMAAVMFKSAEEHRAFVEECLWFPCSLHSGAFTTAIPQKHF